MGNVRAADPRPWQGTSGFRRSLGDYRRSEMQGALLCDGFAAVGRLLRGGFSGGDDGSVSGRTRARLCLFPGSAAADSLRQHEAGGGDDSGRRSAVRHRLDQAYPDKLDGKISEEFWTRKSAERAAQEQQISLAIQGLANATPDRMIDAVRIFGFANKAHFLYVSQPVPEKTKLLRMVLSDCAVDAVISMPF